MPKKETGATAIVKQYLEQYPSLPNRTIARKIVLENKQFKSVEKIRFVIRKLRGAAGQTNRIHSKETKFYNQEYILPEESTYNSSPFKIKENHVLVLSDIHIPFHDKIALTTVINWGKNHIVDAILINGDLIDSYQLSFFSKDPRERNYNQELEYTMEFLETLHETFNVPIYYKLGNHDIRLERYMYDHAAELVGIAEMDIAKFLHLEEFNCKIIRDSRIINIGKLSILHGHEIGKGVFSPVNFARTLYLKAGISTLAGHTHQVSEHSGKRLNGEIVTCWGTGCLCNLRPKYSPINNWSHGFAYVKNTKNTKDSFMVFNARIFNGVVL